MAETRPLRLVTDPNGEKLDDPTLDSLFKTTMTRSGLNRAEHSSGPLGSRAAVVFATYGEVAAGPFSRHTSAMVRDNSVRRDNDGNILSDETFD